VNGERFLLFRAAGTGFAFRLKEVAEVMEPQASYPVPRAPGHFLGLVNFHGTLTALVDLPLFLGLGGRRASGKILVLASKAAHLALQVDGVHSIVTREAVRGESPGDDPLTASLLETDFGPFRLLQLEALLFGLEEGL